MEEQYTGMVYKDIKADLLCDLTEERLNVYDRRINTVADIIISVAKSEIKLMENLKTKAEELKECSRYGGSDLTTYIKKNTWDKIMRNQQILLQAIEKADLLCEERLDTQTMLDNCSMECAVGESDDEYDYREDE